VRKYNNMFKLAEHLHVLLYINRVAYLVPVEKPKLMYNFINKNVKREKVKLTIIFELLLPFTKYQE
jgi:hypothetical protein